VTLSAGTLQMSAVVDEQGQISSSEITLGPVKLQDERVVSHGSL
jgi:hypothetical protein